MLTAKMHSNCQLVVPLTRWRSHCGLCLGKEFAQREANIVHKKKTKKRMDNKFARCLKQNKRKGRTGKQKKKPKRKMSVNLLFIVARWFSNSRSSCVAAASPSTNRWLSFSGDGISYMDAKSIRSVYYQRFSISWFSAGNEDKWRSKILKNFWWPCPGRAGSWSGCVAICSAHEHCDIVLFREEKTIKINSIQLTKHFVEKPTQRRSKMPEYCTFSRLQNCYWWLPFMVHGSATAYAFYCFSQLG